MVRSGMTTSFCATTLVTPSLVAVFMMKKREKEEKWGSKKECQVLGRDRKKWGNFARTCFNLCHFTSELPAS